MKKLITGLALLASVSAFATDCSISIEGISASKQNIVSLAADSLVEKGYTVADNVKYTLDVFVYCFQGNETCASVSKFIDNEKDFNSVQDLRNMHQPLFGKASKESALKASLAMIPECN
jgi:hypothetical protein